MTSIDDLPNEILIEILSYICVQERQRLLTVCKRWKSTIASMWQTSRTLVIRIGRNPFLSFIGWRDANYDNILCSTILCALKILRKFDGKLTKLDLSYNYYPKTGFHRSDLEWIELCNEIKENKRLTSVKMRIIPHRRNHGKYLGFLQFLPTKNLQHLSLTGLPIQNCAFLSGHIESILRTSTLKYLHLDHSTSSIVEMVNKMDTLETLILDGHFWPQQMYGLLSNVPNFSHLEELRISGCKGGINNALFTEICNNCKSLRVLALRCDASLTQSGLNTIRNLRNLKLLDLHVEESLNCEVLCTLPNLEELDLQYTEYDEDEEYHRQLLGVLQKIPTLKYFYSNNKLILRLVVSDRNMGPLKSLSGNTPDASWDRVLGLPTHQQ